MTRNITKKKGWKNNSPRTHNSWSKRFIWNSSGQSKQSQIRRENLRFSNNSRRKTNSIIILRTKSDTQKISTSSSIPPQIRVDPSTSWKNYLSRREMSIFPPLIEISRQTHIITGRTELCRLRANSCREVNKSPDSNLLSSKDQDRD